MVLTDITSVTNRTVLATVKEAAGQVQAQQFQYLN
jgi:hypothetical protein